MIFGTKIRGYKKIPERVGAGDGVNFVAWVALWLRDTVANEMLNGGRKHPVACGTGTVADKKALLYRLHDGCGCEKSPSELAQWRAFWYFSYGLHGGCGCKKSQSEWAQ